MVEVRAEMVANVWQVKVCLGDEVVAGSDLVVLESMKMEIPIQSPISGTVVKLLVVVDQVVAEGDLMVVVE